MYNVPINATLPYLHVLSIWSIHNEFDRIPCLLIDYLLSVLLQVLSVMGDMKASTEQFTGGAGKAEPSGKEQDSQELDEDRPTWGSAISEVLLIEYPRLN